MHEIHANDQYFFDDKTLDHLTSFLAGWVAPCCICAPLLGKHAAESGVPVTILDIDERFSDVEGFRFYDLYKPSKLDQRFGLILCDPPFSRVSLSQLFTALRILSHNDLGQPMMVSHLASRTSAVVGTFVPFNLQPTGYRPSYRTVKKVTKNEIEFFSNLTCTKLKALRGCSDHIKL